MPKPLRETPPTSSVARIFDMEAAARAVAAPEPPSEVPPRPPSTGRAERERISSQEAPGAASLGEQPNIKRDLVLTPSTAETFRHLVELYRRSTGTQLTASHVARALLKGVAHCMDTLEREAKKIGRQKLPSNARGKELDRERFEALIADAFVAGIRSAAAFEVD